MLSRSTKLAYKKKIAVLKIKQILARCNLDLEKSRSEWVKRCVEYAKGRHIPMRLVTHGLKSNKMLCDCRFSRKPVYAIYYSSGGTKLYHTYPVIKFGCEYCGVFLDAYAYYDHYEYPVIAKFGKYGTSRFVRYEGSSSDLWQYFDHDHEAMANYYNFLYSDLSSADGKQITLCVGDFLGFWNY
tara:strand:- start:125 stop:676 length:552 start_codon:yes stop_codon:yes gene_type:complete